MRKWTALAIGVVLLASCQSGKVDPRAAVRVSGRVLDAAGRPLSGATVQLFKEADLADAVLGIVLTVGSLGAVCLFPAAPAICHRGRVTKAGADGSYRFDLKGSDTQGLIGSASTLDVVVADPRGGAEGASTTASFTVKAPTVSLPDVRLWDAGLRLDQTAGRTRLGWSQLPPADGRGAGYTVRFLDPVRRATIWSQPASSASVEVDPRVLEDARSVAAAAAGATLSGPSGDARLAYLSSRLAVTPTAGPPPSRHKPCLALGGAPPFVARAQPTCPVTDGDLITAGRLSAGAPVVVGAVVDLGSVRPVNLVVVRGSAAGFLVEVSADGTSYRQVGVGAGQVAAVTPPGRTTGRYVRVRSASGLDESLMTELSVW